MIHTIRIITTPCGPRWVAAMGFLVATSIALTGCQTGNASNAPTRIKLPRRRLHFKAPLPSSHRPIVQLFRSTR